MTLLWIGSGLLAAFSAWVVHLYFRGPTESRSDEFVDVLVPTARVFDVFADFSRWKRIWTRIAELHPPPDPVEVGSSFWWSEVDGQRVDARVVRWDPGACVQLDLERVGRPMARRVTMRFEPLERPEGEACRATMVDELKFEASRDRVWVPLTKPMTNLANRGVLWRLKVEAEADDEA